MTDAPETPRNPRLGTRLKIILAVIAVVVVAGLVVVSIQLLSGPPADTSRTADNSPTEKPVVTVEVSPTPTPTASPTAETPAVDPDAEAPAEPAADAAPAAPAPAPPIPPVIPKPRVDNMAAILNDTSCGTRSYATVVWVTSGANANSATMSIRSSGTPQFAPETWSALATTAQSDFPFDCTRPLTYFTVTVTNASGSASGLLVWSNSTQSFAPYSPPAQ